MPDSENILSRVGIRPTPNRILIFRALSESHSPLSLMDLEGTLDSLDKSSISRVLSLFTTRHLVHVVEDGRGILRYELCRSPHSSGKTDLHVHFYCEECRKVFCLEDTPLPEIVPPEGFEVSGFNCMLKGVCPDCLKTRRHDRIS